MIINFSGDYSKSDWISDPLSGNFSNDILSQEIMNLRTDSASLPGEKESTRASEDTQEVTKHKTKYPNQAFLQKP